MLSQPELNKYGMDGSFSERDALKELRREVLNYGDKIREMIKVQTRTIDFAKQFTEVQLAIDLQSRELARTLFVLDRSMAAPLGAKVESPYLDGAWVKQGTVAFSRGLAK
jgi:hypothetical protein